MEAWGNIPLASTSATGNVTQLYPTWASYAPGLSVGTALPVPAGSIYRRPSGGRVGTIQVETDSTNGGIIQLFDINGLDALADVSSATNITNAQLTSLIANNQAKLIWEQNFASAPGAPLVWNWMQGFLRGLGARFVGLSGTCKLNIIGEGGFQYITAAGPYAGG